MQSDKYEGRLLNSFIPPAATDNNFDLYIYIYNRIRPAKYTNKTTLIISYYYTLNKRIICIELKKLKESAISSFNCMENLKFKYDLSRYY